MTFDASHIRRRIFVIYCHRNIDNLSFSVMKELNDIISQSKEWTLKSIDNEPDSNSFKINNKQIEEKQLDIFYEQEKKDQIDKKNNAFNPVKKNGKIPDFN